MDFKKKIFVIPRYELRGLTSEQYKMLEIKMMFDYEDDVFGKNVRDHLISYGGNLNGKWYWVLQLNERFYRQFEELARTDNIDETLAVVSNEMDEVFNEIVQAIDYKEES